MIIVCSFKVTLGKRIVCESNNIMHYIMLKPVQTMSTFTRLTTYKQCLSYNESKIFSLPTCSLSFKQIGCVYHEL